MSEKRASLEIIAPTVEDAIAKGLDELGLPRDAVEVDVLDSGSRGLFGLGSRQARVRLMVRSYEVDEDEPEPSAAPFLPEKRPPVMPSTPVTPPPPMEDELTPTLTPAEAEPVAARVREEEAEEAEEELEAEEAVTAEPLDEDALRVARGTVMDLLERMQVTAEVTAQYGEPDDAHSRTPLIVDVRGKDLSILIGPRAETLNALQYIASLIVGKELGRSIPLIVDVEGFRARREQQLRALARRMAEQAVRTGRRQVLEPMPANERRIIHIELRSNSKVTTESVGEDPRRKVTIIPK